MGVRNQAAYIPSLKQDAVENTISTFTTGTTQTITNAQIRANSFIAIQHITQPAGNWSIVVANGSMLITSSSAETDATFKYRIL